MWLSDISTKSSAQDIKFSWDSISVTESHSASDIVCRSFWNMLPSVGLKLHPCLTPVEEGNVSDKDESGRNIHIYHTLILAMNRTCQ